MPSPPSPNRVKRKSEVLGIRIITNDNINSSHLNNSGLYLNKRRTVSLAKNFIDAIWLVRRTIHDEIPYMNNEESTKTY